MKNHVEFRSDSFAPYQGEEDEVNPGLFGKRLAEFLVPQLENRGYVVKDLFSEDWGWVISLENAEFPLWIGCGRYEEYPNGFLCFIEPHEPFVKKFLFFGKIDTRPKVDALRQALDEILSSEPSVSDIKWWTHDEFNNPQL
jgi:hypothetical protein